ncbi:response regulator transcription factor [Paracoccus sp. 11-3]|uniref:Response regulator transcription factor n=1 Tax=Paracoccus amoyensis TaxID=2760093 RepID=A0A926G7E9_9RHOB|nr:response regulator transcription factor [Paracoccus amoyensis]MBC9247213.1 response regulator transcription factor [Paracoccus amoyensis]
MEVIDISNAPSTQIEVAGLSMPEVIFVGTQRNFSPSLITATTQELGQVIADVLTSFNDLHKLIQQTGHHPTVIIIDEPTLRNLHEADRQLLYEIDAASIGLAYASTTFAAAWYNDHTLRLRSVSVFPLNVRLDVWLSIIRLIAHGAGYVCPEVMLFKEPDPKTLAEDEFCLTQRQIDVLQLVADGQSNKRIADRLGLSVHTVKLHLHNASQRLGARNRTEAAMRYQAVRK